MDIGDIKGVYGVMGPNAVVDGERLLVISIQCCVQWPYGMYSYVDCTLV